MLLKTRDLENLLLDWGMEWCREPDCPVLINPHELTRGLCDRHEREARRKSQELAELEFSPLSNRYRMGRRR